MIYVWNVWDKPADIKEENHIFVRTVGAYAEQAYKHGIAKPKEYFHMFHSEDEAMMAYADGLIDMHDPIKVWKELEIDGAKQHRIIDATVGRLIINDAIPQNLGFKKRETTDDLFGLEIDFVVGKKQLGKIIDNCIRINGFTLSTEMLDKVKALGYKYSTKSVHHGLDRRYGNPGEEVRADSRGRERGRQDRPPVQARLHHQRRALPPDGPAVGEVHQGRHRTRCSRT